MRITHFAFSKRNLQSFNSNPNLNTANSKTFLICIPFEQSTQLNAVRNTILFSGSVFFYTQHPHFGRVWIKSAVKSEIHLAWNGLKIEDIIGRWACACQSSSLLRYVHRLATSKCIRRTWDCINRLWMLSLQVDTHSIVNRLTFRCNKSLHFAIGFYYCRWWWCYFQTIITHTRNVLYNEKKSWQTPHNFSFALSLFLLFAFYDLASCRAEMFKYNKKRKYQFDIHT